MAQAEVPVSPTPPVLCADQAAIKSTTYLPQRRKMMQHWADHLDALRQSAKVLPIKARRA